MKVKTVIVPLSILGAAMLLTACSPKEETTSGSSSATASSSSAIVSSEETTASSSVDLNALELPQLESELKENESAVEMETTEGTIKIKLFPEIAPKAVENFMTHAKDGYYDGITFHRVINEFMIQGGDPEGTGAGGESIWGKPFENEPSKQLYNIRGALSMANAGADTNGSQFFIVQNSSDMSDGLLYDDYPKAIVDAYKKGGSPHLDGDYTVFGQVYDGMDVVDKIATAKVESDGQTPTDPVKIKSIKILQEAK